MEPNNLLIDLEQTLNDTKKFNTAVSYTLFLRNKLKEKKEEIEKMNKQLSYLHTEFIEIENALKQKYVDSLEQLALLIQK